MEGDWSDGDDDGTADISQVTSSRFVGAELSSADPCGLAQSLSTCHDSSPPEGALLSLNSFFDCHDAVGKDES
jgi:hypothetical protein